ncbi:LysM peptidoglycan-binding domain-containing protein [Kitasatospora sp. NPDC056184]|uniref:LysM peptidoglycan-binding domain-containing protein n=1 Tax=Kitasatospora sp. NPDC056184 TaxID=3345738 RepID=UPI0035D6F636
MPTPNDVITQALKHVDYREGPNNDTVFNRRFGRIPGYPADGYGYPWCQSFQSIIFKDAGMRPDADYPWTAACASATQWFTSRGRFDRTPKVGDQALFGTDGGSHVELVIAVFNDGRDIETIGGNTNSGQSANGDGVYRKRYNNWASTTRIHGFGHPAYSATGGGQTTPPNGGQGTKFKVAAGMTLLGIAAALGVPLADLLAANPEIRNPDQITEGQVINVPQKPVQPTPQPTEKPTEKPTPKPTEKPVERPSGDSYTVKRGDTLGVIAKAHGVTLAALLKANPGRFPNPDLIEPGQKVTIPAGNAQKPQAKPSTPKPPTRPATPPTTTESGIYTVKKGDTLSGIARAHHIELPALLAANAGRFPDPDLIFPGQRVFLPVRSKTPNPPAKPKPPVDQRPTPATPPSKQPEPSGGATADSLLPLPLTHAQSSWDFTPEMRENAAIIRQEAHAVFGAGLGDRAAVIGVATAIQESGLKNLRYGDQDSLGLFQQRPSMGWGTVAQVTDPHYAARKFFTTMKELAPGKFGPDYLTKVPLYQVSHIVQLSGSPEAPAKYERAAAQIVAQLAKGGSQ